MAFDPHGRMDIEAAAKAAMYDAAGPGYGPGAKFLEPHIADAYRSGFRDALRLFGIYRNGTQVIGCLEHPIKEIIAKVADAGIPIDEFSKDI